MSADIPEGLRLQQAKDEAVVRDLEALTEERRNQIRQRRVYSPDSAGEVVFNLHDTAVLDDPENYSLEEKVASSRVGVYLAGKFADVGTVHKYIKRMVLLVVIITCLLLGLELRRMYIQIVSERASTQTLPVKTEEMQKTAAYNWTMALEMLVQPDYDDLETYRMLSSKCVKHDPGNPFFVTEWGGVRYYTDLESVCNATKIASERLAGRASFACAAMLATQSEQVPCLCYYNNTCLTNPHVEEVSNELAGYAEVFELIGILEPKQSVVPVSLNMTYEVDDGSGHFMQRKRVHVEGPEVAIVFRMIELMNKAVY
jgi:hypothetical protein